VKRGPVGDRLRQAIALRKRPLLFVAGHLLVVVLGWWRLGANDFEVIFVPGLTGLVLFVVAFLRTGGHLALVRFVGRALIATIACAFAWLVVFGILANIVGYHEVLMFGLVVALPLATFSSGLGLVLGMRPFRKRDADER
jgi:hypothetical protein